MDNQALARKVKKKKVQIVFQNHFSSEHFKPSHLRVFSFTTKPSARAPQDFAFLKQTRSTTAAKPELAREKAKFQGGLSQFGDMEHRLGNTTSTNFWHHLSDLSKSPRGTVIRIEVLALVAIAFSFFLVAFGSCRRWSKRWIIQKGVLAANVLSLSLGTYSIGLMQSSPVKNEMYPVWAASLLSLFVSIDSITAYSLDYNSQFLKLLYQLCLYCGYVLLIAISTISSDVGNISIGVLCVITFIKGFHRSLACVLLSSLRNMNKLIADYMEDSKRQRFDYDPVTLRGYPYVVDWPLDRAKSDSSKSTTKLAGDEVITIDKIWHCNINSVGSNAPYYKDVCLSFSLSHLLQRRFFGFRCAESSLVQTRRFVFKGLLQRDGVIDYERAFKVIEVELAFLYDLFFTNNAFLHYYESKVSTVWAFASIISIVFVGVATVIPGTRTTRASGGIVVVNTTKYDLIITVVILASLALLQLLQLIRCWTSNWARVDLVCQSLRNGNGSCWMTLKAFLCRINRFNVNYLWQNKLGQYSLVETISTRESMLVKHAKRPFTACDTLSRMFGLQYIEQVFQEMFGSNTGNPVVLTADVKKSIVDTLIRTDGRPRNGSSSLEANDSGRHLLWACTQDARPGEFIQAKDNQTRIILTWHIATCYLEMELCKNYCLNENTVKGKELKLHHDVATKLSRYCAYLIVSAPQLISGQYSFTKSVYNAVVRDARLFLHGEKDRYEAMRGLHETEESEEMVFQRGVRLGKQLEEIQDVTLRWKVLADFWAEMLLYAAPSDDVKEHIEHLAQGGEFITHLWALLFHAGIVKREVQYGVQTWV